MTFISLHMLMFQCFRVLVYVTSKAGSIHLCNNWISVSALFFEQDDQKDFFFYSEPSLRFSLALSDEEKKFLEARKQRVFHSMQRHLGDRGPVSLNEVH